MLLKQLDADKNFYDQNQEVMRQKIEDQQKLIAELSSRNAQAIE